jgi:hypothetical protein
MGSMRTLIAGSGRTVAALLVTGMLVGSLAACGGPTPSTSTAPSEAPVTAAPPASAAVDPTPIATPVAELTPVPFDTDEPNPPPGGGGTTVIDWGTILDLVPEGFPVFPGASPSEAVDGPSSGTWFAGGAAVDEVAAWYRDQLEALGFTTRDLSSPLEDGSRVLDTVSDLPECRIRTTFRPADGSTMIIVLYGAGCAGGEG